MQEWYALSVRERQFIELLVRDPSDKEIAKALGISQNTVRYYFTRLFAKTGCTSRVQLANWGRRILLPGFEISINLSSRQRQIAESVALGLHNKQIAERLGITANTARDEVSALLRKLNLHTRTELATWWTRYSSS